MPTVCNAHGGNIDFDAAVEHMDDDLRERPHDELAPCSESKFFRVYCAAHRFQFGEEFEPNKRNPNW